MRRAARTARLVRPLLATLLTCTPATAGALALAACRADATAPVVAARTAARKAPAPAPAPAPATLAAAGCDAYTGARTVAVATAAQLTSAVNAALPGDKIVLADGTYAGRWTVTRSGTAASRIVLCGTRAAVVDGGSMSSGYALHFNGADYWTVDGIDVRGAQKAIVGTDADFTLVTNVAAHDVGQEGVHWQRNSSDNTLDGVVITNTGRVSPQYGEGVYVGLPYTQWTNGQPDRSDRNVVRNSTIGPGVTADLIDVKEGTTGGAIENNHLDGVDRVTNDPSGPSSPDCVTLKGNGYTVTGNTCVHPDRDGVWVFQQVSGWGTGNTVAGNTVDLAGAPLAGGYGFRITSGGNTLKCANTVTGGAFANVGCTP